MRIFSGHEGLGVVFLVTFNNGTIKVRNSPKFSYASNLCSVHLYVPLATYVSLMCYEQGGLIMDVVNADQARVAQEAGVSLKLTH